jgi:hypothetical protein
MNGCLVCNRGPWDGTSLYRVNRKGTPAVWACNAHIANADCGPPDAELRQIVEALERGERPPDGDNDGR